MPWRLGHKTERKPIGKGLKEASNAFRHPRNPPPEQQPGANQPRVLMSVGPCTVHTETYRCTCEQGSHVSTTGMVDPNQLCHGCLHPFSLHNEYAPLKHTRTQQSYKSGSDNRHESAPSSSRSE